MDNLEKIFKAVSDRNRMRIIKLLEKRAMCVCELAFVLGISQPAISRHLKKMILAGLVDSQQDGFWTNYFLNTSSEYSRTITRMMKGWLSDDATVMRDESKAKKANREKLCCPRNKK